MRVIIENNQFNVTGDLQPVETAPKSKTGKSKIVLTSEGFQKVKAADGTDTGYSYTMTVIKVIPKAERKAEGKA